MENTTPLTHEATLKAVDDALKLDRTLHTPPPDPTKVTSAKKASALSRLLRGIGGTVIIAAAVTFLFQHWGMSDHILRYLSFLGFTALLSAAGFLCGIRLNEDKGARTFLGIAAAIIPINFCALGGLGYSRVLIHSGKVIPYYNAIHWVAPSDLAALLTTLVAVSVLIPLALISFTALFRAEAKRVTAVFMLSNALLLIPTREPNITALLATLLFLGLVRFDLTCLRPSAGIRTTEGKITRAVIFLPFLALMARTLNLYLLDLTSIFVSILFAAGAAFLYKYLPAYLKSREGINASQRLSTIPAILSWLCLINEWVKPFGIQGIAEFALWTIPPSLILIIMSLGVSEEVSGQFRKLASVNGTISAALGLMIFSGVGAAFLCITMSVLTTAYGFSSESRATFVAGLAGLAFGLLYHLRYAMELYSYSPWISLAVLGIVTVVASSYIEKYSGTLREAVQRLVVKKGA